MEIKQELKDQKIKKAIKNFASNPEAVSITENARKDILALRLTKKDVCSAIVDWIERNQVTTLTLAKHPQYIGQGLFIMLPEIAGIEMYVKVQLRPSASQAEKMVIVSAKKK